MAKQSNRGGLRNPPGGRPPKAGKDGPVMVSTSIRLPPALLEWLKENTTNRNEWIIEAIREKMKNDQKR